MKPKKILVIDDEAPIREYSEVVLKASGYDVSTVENGLNGLKLFRKIHQDLILVDLRMPEMDGLTVISEIRRTDPDVPIIVISGTGAIEDAIGAIRRGAWDYIAKPVTSKEVLKHAVDKALERARLIEENKRFQKDLQAEVKRQTAELQKAYEKLQQSEAQYRSVVEDQTETILRYNSEQKITFVNASCSRYFGRPEEELLGMSYFDLVSESDRAAVAEKISKLGKHSAVATDERRVPLPGKKYGWQQWTDRRLFDAAGKPIGYQAVGIDITERKLGEEALKNALEEVEKLKNQLQDENIYLREEIKLDHNFEDIIGQSRAILDVLKNIELIAPNDTTVLIQGESGTGKELIARAIHDLSRRKNRPLVKVNCAALPANLIESELFGHEKGAFTGASIQRKGRFELANGGTIFLDEISELPLDLQTKLLRVIQESEFERVGGETTLHIDVRIIAATNRDLEASVANGIFREDLYYRLNVIPLKVPPLRERRDDIPLLAKYFAEKYGRKMGKSFKSVSVKTMDFLKSFDWPGNIRELENVIERAAIFSREPVLKLDHPVFVPKKINTQGRSSLRSLEIVEREHIELVLQHTKWVIEGNGGAAAILDLHPNTLRSRMKKLGIKKPGR
jgi:PAS domain S-box-containing protein